MSPVQTANNNGMHRGTVPKLLTWLSQFVFFLLQFGHITIARLIHGYGQIKVSNSRNLKHAIHYSLQA